MDYKQKYKEALERAKDNYNAANSANINVDSFKNTLIHIFPELKEPEDERIRKALISILKSDFENDTTIHDISVGDIIAWLEKQSKQSSNILWHGVSEEPKDYTSIDPHFGKNINNPLNQ